MRRLLLALAAFMALASPAYAQTTGTTTLDPTGAESQQGPTEAGNATPSSIVTANTTTTSTTIEPREDEVEEVAPEAEAALPVREDPHDDAFYWIPLLMAIGAGAALALWAASSVVTDRR